MFANPIFLWALLAGAVPVLLHLIWRRRRTTLLHPTLRFLQRTRTRLASRRRLRELLLLLLRVLVLWFLALALARPGLQRAHASSQGQATAVLILDNSASMGLATATGTRLDRARSRARAVLETLGPASRAAILPTLAEEMAPSSRTWADPGEAQRLLDELQPLDGAPAWTGALERAREILAQEPGTANREVHLFTDLQENGWSDRKALLQTLARLPEQTAVYCWTLEGGPPSPNSALLKVEGGPGPKLAGRPLPFTVTVQNPSGSPVRTSLAAGWAGQAPLSLPLALEAGQRVEVPLTLPPAPVGLGVLELQLEEDAAAFDNRLDLAVEIREPLRVLLIAPPSAPAPALAPAFFLKRALDPTGDGRLSGAIVQLAAPGAAIPEQTEVAVLCGLEGLTPEAAGALLRWVAEGHGLLVWAAGPLPAALAPETLRMLLCGRPGTEERLPETDPPLGLRLDPGLSAWFRDPAATPAAFECQGVAVWRHLRLDPAPEALVLARFTNRDPALLAWRHGKGEQLCWSCPVDPQATNLPLKPVFLALLHRSVIRLAAETTALPCLVAGSPLSLDLSPRTESGKASEFVTLFTPKGRKHLLRRGGGRLVWSGTGQRGVYRLEVPEGTPGKQAASRIPRGFTVVPDPGESTGGYWTLEQARSALPARILMQDHSSDPAQVLATTRRGQDLFEVFLALALLALLSEAWLANGRIKPAPAAEGGSWPADLSSRLGETDGPGQARKSVRDEATARDGGGRGAGAGGGREVAAPAQHPTGSGKSWRGATDEGGQRAG